MGAAGEGGPSQPLPGGVVAELGETAQDGPAGTGLAPLECTALSREGELRGMEFHLSAKSPPRPAQPLAQEGAGPVPSCPARLVWVLLESRPAPATGGPMSQGTQGPARPRGGAQIRLAQLCPSPGSRGPLAYLTR